MPEQTHTLSRHASLSEDIPRFYGSVVQNGKWTRSNLLKGEAEVVSPIYIRKNEDRFTWIERRIEGKFGEKIRYLFPYTREDDKTLYSLNYTEDSY